jgi:hypothetical protein
VDLGIVIPLVVLPLLVVGGFLWYRRSIAELAPDENRPVSGVRLTAEVLHRDAAPPWRVVHEIGGALGGVDHVVIGPAGIIAITTVVTDRPSPDDLIRLSGETQLVSEAAVNRGPVDEVARPSEVPCRVWARVYWGAPAVARPPHDELVHGSQLVEGQRVGEWLNALAAATDEPLDPATIDRAWQAVVTGIGRPDPLG